MDTYETYISDKLKEIRSSYSSKYYNYVATITFKDGKEYADKNPRTAFKLFNEHIKKYLKKKGIKASIYCEIGRNGRFHCHGLFHFYQPENDYKKHELEYKLVKNYINRNYGLNYFQQILDVNQTYKTDGCMRFHKLSAGMYTSLEKIVRYITKDMNEYDFIKPIIVT